MGDAIQDRIDPPASGGRPRVWPITDPAVDPPLVNRQYSDWPTAWIRPDGVVIVFAGFTDDQVRFFQLDRTTGTVMRLGVPLPQYPGVAEGWYWDAAGGLTLCDGPRLRRVTPFVGQDQILLDCTETHPGCRLWQAHSSDDGQTHAATVEEITAAGPYRRVGTLIVHHGRRLFVRAAGVLDESTVTRDGAFCLIKEDADNRILTLSTGEERRLRDAEGAVGHCDVGDSLVVGEDNVHGACVAWDLRGPLSPFNRRELFQTWNLGHLSLRRGRCLQSDPTHLTRVDLATGARAVLLAHGMTGPGYDDQVRASLDPTGSVATYLSNVEGAMRLFLVEWPA